MSTGTGLMRRVMDAVGRLSAVRIFRNTVGMGWVGQATRRRDGTVVIKNARPLHAGLFAGSGDLIGWTTIEIRPEHVGSQIAVFTSIEVKDGSGRPDEDQLNWADQVRKAGGIAVIARSEEDAIRAVSEKV